MNKSTPYPDMNGYNNWKPSTRDRTLAFGALRRGLELAHEYEYLAERHPYHSDMLYSAAAVVRRTLRVSMGIESLWME